jgi:hypothetical protein
MIKSHSILLQSVGEKSSMNRFADVKKSKREEIEDQIDWFLKSGRRIKKIKTGVTAQIPRRVGEYSVDDLEIIEEIKKGA